jgi:hypothetical protein
LESICAMVLPPPALAPVMPPVIVPIVQLKVLGLLAVSAILVAVLSQIVAVGALVTTGVGYTVTVAIILNAVPTQPFSEVGVTTYSTVPELTALGLVSAWLIRLPLPALAPVMPPVIVPIVQVNVLGTLAVSAMFGLPPLQIAAGGAFVTAGSGLTVTTIEYGALEGQSPPVDVGVTRYSTVPAAELLGLLSVCAMVLPLPAPAPVIPPVIVPIVHANVLGAVAFREIFVAVLLHIATVEGTPVTCGVGFTVTVTT